MHGGIDVSVAVATERGLITPIVKDADLKGLAQISAEMRDLAKRAREGKLKLEEFQGGSMTVSNLGMYGVRDFAAIINPPQSTILAVGAAQRRPVETEDGGVRFETQMTVTLSCDHRVIDGALGAQLLAALGERYPQLEPAARLKLAINQTHAKPTAPIRAGDEVAVFEPVTGG